MIIYRTDDPLGIIALLLTAFAFHVSYAHDTCDVRGRLTVSRGNFEFLQFSVL